MENMALADSVKEGFTIHIDRRAYNMLLKSGLIPGQINHIYGYVHDTEATELEPKKTQDAILPVDVQKNREPRTTAPRFSRPLI